MFRPAIAVVALGLFLAPAGAGEFNKKISIGDSAPKFAAKGTDGKEYTLDSFKDKDVLVICVTCNHCPVAVAYEDRIIDFAKKYAGKDGKVAFLAVNVNLGEDDLLPKMKERAREKGFTFPYAIDETQRVGRDLGASRTPEFFVFNKDRKLVYQGAMDDDMAEPKVNYVAAAVEATLKGAKVERAETRVRGCPVQYTNK
jgi:peroxiredoxin